MTKLETVLQCVKIALMLLFGGGAIWWGLEVLRLLNTIIGCSV
jgi:hypothetical protein